MTRTYDVYDTKGDSGDYWWGDVPFNSRVQYSKDGNLLAKYAYDEKGTLASSRKFTYYN